MVGREGSRRESLPDATPDGRAQDSSGAGLEPVAARSAKRSRLIQFVARLQSVLFHMSSLYDRALFSFNSVQVTTQVIDCEVGHNLLLYRLNNNKS